ncbi:lipid A deacylase LpxR family protein [Hymenobacter sp. BT683]|uniref:Lipid A deacylase LpxR family protein n=1 Tax=Hymenobacter jeongseonensis TaxID=2791027 RepID=A0ABS0IL34_9BACT|nr:lipid A deacylase LpxR family protein [Hymenobacter jeongseonensis]MBF9239051.1 lipid A deacylase LpxR family protein [Hymenobacter jeongseonensis]
MRVRFCFLLVALLAGAMPAGAAPALSDTLRPTSPERLLRYTYANDFLARTDYYFTQGMTLTLVLPSLARLPTQRVLLRGAPGSTQYHGVLLRYDGFTPLRIQDPFIRFGDRPYASYVYASFFRVSNQPTRRRRLTSALEVGFIGPGTFAKEFQTAIHRATNNPEPRGWDYQIRTDAVLGYRVGYERQLLAVAGVAEVIGHAEASLGTLYTYASTGAQLRLGLLQPYFTNLGVGSGTSQPGRSRWQVYAHTSLEGRLVGYDATLQGGLFNQSSPYVLPAGAVTRTVLRNTTGLVLAHKGFSLDVTSTWISPEFAGARSHSWGKLALTAAF